MSDQAMLDLLGYAASVLVAISLMMSSVLRLRVINLAGAVTFTVYGVLIDAYPVAAVNLLIVAINIYYIRKMLTTGEYFGIVDVDRESGYLRAFLRYYEGQIERFFPGFSPPADPDVAVFVLRDMVPAGVLMGTLDGDTLRVHLDFVIPQFRDLKVGRYLYHDRCEYFARRGIRTIAVTSASPAHYEYLSRMGFTPDPLVAGSAGGYTLRLPC